MCCPLLAYNHVTQWSKLWTNEMPAIVHYPFYSVYTQNRSGAPCSMTRMFSYLMILFIFLDILLISETCAPIFCRILDLPLEHNSILVVGLYLFLPFPLFFFTHFHSFSLSLPFIFPPITHSPPCHSVSPLSLSLSVTLPLSLSYSFSLYCFFSHRLLALKYMKLCILTEFCTIHDFLIVRTILDQVNYK